MKKMADDGTDDILRSIKDAQRNALIWSGLGRSGMKKCDVPAQAIQQSPPVTSWPP